MILRLANKSIGSEVDVLIWSIIEIYTAIICASLMTIKPLVIKYLPGVFSATQNSSSRRSKTFGQSWSTRNSRNSRNSNILAVGLPNLDRVDDMASKAESQQRLCEDDVAIVLETHGKDIASHVENEERGVP